MPKKKSVRKRSDVGPRRPPKEHRFTPGNPGGPGRPKGDIIKRLRELIEDGLDGKDLADIIAKKIISEAMRGNYRLTATLLDRLYGKAPITLQGPDGGPVKIIQISQPDQV